MADLSAQSIAVVVLAAGRGSRMGDAHPPKLLLPWREGKPVLWHTVQNALSTKPLEVVVVVRPDLPEMVEALHDLPVRCVPNPRYMEGMGTSLAVGIGAVGDGAQGALLLLGDEPEMPGHVVEGLLAAYVSEGKLITIPRYGAQVGPPTLFAKSIFPELVKLGGDEGARSLVKEHPDWVCIVPFKEEERPQDLDTPEDYQNAMHET